MISVNIVVATATGFLLRTPIALSCRLLCSECTLAVTAPSHLMQVEGKISTCNLGLEILLLVLSVLSYKSLISSSS